MIKRIVQLYFALIVLGFFFLLYVGLTFQVDAFRVEESRKVKEYTDFTVIKETEKSLVLQAKMPSTTIEGTYLAFISYHCDVQVYIENELIYHIERSKENEFGKTVGKVCNMIQLKDEYLEKDITIHLNSAYGAIDIPVIYQGARLSIFSRMLKEGIFSFLICSIIIFLGIAMIGYWIYARFRTLMDNRLFYLGIFAVLLGIWSINEIPMTILIIRNGIVSSYLACVILMFLPLPFLMFVKELYHKRNHIVWCIASSFSVFNISLCLILQVANVADLKETLWITHVSLGIMMVTLVYFTVQEIRLGIISYKVKLNLMCIVIDVLTSIIDIICYYFVNSDDANVFGRIGFLIHVVVLGWLATRDSAALIQKGKEAELYEMLAYQDAMTGLGNRTAFERKMASIHDKENVTILMMDLNDLKKCNDTLGHEAGDRYIKNASRIIQMVFDKIGTSYRIGGDEFCVLIQSGTLEEANRIVRVLLPELIEREREFNEKSPQEPVEIAYGYAIFDTAKDATLSDTRKRADYKMYDMKTKMKQERKNKN